MLDADFSVPVEVVGGSSPFWHSLVGPAAAAITAIVAAWIAARTANHRQQEQLAHDRDLQDRQLRHDREQRGRERTRDTIDEAIVNVYSAFRAMAEFEGSITVGDQRRSERRSELKELKNTPNDLRQQTVLSAFQDELAAVRKAKDKTYEASVDLASYSLRLVVRLGQQHAIVIGHDAFREAYAARIEVLAERHKQSLTDEDRLAMKSADRTQMAAYQRFLSACRSWVEED